MKRIAFIPIIFLVCSAAIMIAGDRDVSMGDSVRALMADKVECVVSVKESENSKIVLELQLTNRSKHTIYMRHRETPWRQAHLLNVYFSTDLKDRNQEPKGWGTIVLPSHGYGPVPKEEPDVIESKRTVVKQIPLQEWKDAIGPMRARTNVYVNWNFPLTIYDKNPVVPKTQSPPTPIGSVRIGGFFILPKLETSPVDVTKSEKP